LNFIPGFFAKADFFLIDFGTMCFVATLRAWPADL
jgi:hypothetical protein